MPEETSSLNYASPEESADATASAPSPRKRGSGQPKVSATPPPQATRGSVAAAMFLQLRSECEELRRRMAMVPRATQTAAIQIAELEKAILSIRRARDTTLSQIQGLTEKLKESGQRNEELLEIQAATQQSADAAGAELEATRQENEELRGLLQIKDNDHAAAMRDLEERVQSEHSLPMGASTQKLMNAQLATARDRIASLEARFEATQQQHKESVATIVENLLRTERRQSEAEEIAAQLQAQLQEMTGEREQYREAFELAQGQIAEFQAETARVGGDADLAFQLEQQRQQIAELSTQLDAARDEVRLAWAVNRTEEPLEHAAVEPAATAAEVASEPLENQEACLLIEDMEQTLAMALGAREPGEILGVLANQVKEFAQRTLCTGSVSSYRILGVCSEVVEWMQKTPTKMAAMQGTLQGAFQLLGKIAESNEVSVHGDTMEASVYVVDDDLDNCDCIAMSLDRIGLRTHYASKPELAVQHLLAEKADLIFLDVDLGSTNGFEVQKRLRQIPHHRQTPVLFVSGMNSARAQVAQLGNPEDDFLGKPYTLAELRLKALCMIVAARLSFVPAA